MKIAYTIKETAEALGCGMNTAYILVNSGQLKSFKFGKKIMIPAQSIEELIKNKTCAS
ncbi:helix-turn-helix domain-containing protein [Gammaproteobacteria bacterium]|nr:helix-turn-helix domain-containing protein [Gammaproteobacteria bacterium]